MELSDKRTKDVLLQGFDDMKLIMQAMYLGEKIKVKNAIGVPLELTMTDNGTVMAGNLNFPDTQPTNWHENMTVEACMAIREQLEESPAEEYPKNFESRWAELKMLTSMNISQNRMQERGLSA